MFNILHKISEKIAFNICSLNNVNDEVQYEKICYGLEIIISTAASVLTVLILSLFFGRFLETLVFVLSFMFLRTYSGGYHASTHLRCFGILTFTFAVNMLLLQITRIYNSVFVSWGLIIASGAVIICFAPIIDKNHPLSKKQIKRNRLVCRINLIILIFLAVLFNITALKIYLFNIAYAMAVTAFSILAVNIRLHAKEVKSHE